jgi:Tol biopolymer transport system component
VAFQSDATQLVAVDDLNNTLDVFVHDLQTGRTECVSLGLGGSAANGYSDAPSVSSDGRFVAFRSDATDLDAVDTTADADVFVRDMQTGVTTLVSVASDGSQSEGVSWMPAISADGRFVAFLSAARLVPGDTNATQDVFVRDLQTATTTRINLASDGTQANWAAFCPAISADGRFVGFCTMASNLVPGDTNGSFDVFVHDTHTATTTRVSVASDGAQGSQGGSGPSLSADGRFVAFVSYSENLVAGDTNNRQDVFVHDRSTGQTRRVLGANGQQGTWNTGFVQISLDGRFVAFSSRDDTLVPNDTNWSEDVFRAVNPHL